MTAKCDAGSWTRKKDIRGTMSLGSADEGWRVIFGAILYFIYKPALFQSEKVKDLKWVKKKNVNLQPGSLRWQYGKTTGMRSGCALQAAMLGTRRAPGGWPWAAGLGQMGEDLSVTEESTVLTATELGLHAKQCIPLYSPLPPHYERHWLPLNSKNSHFIQLFSFV